MKFKEFRDLIFSPCYVIKDGIRVYIETHYDSDFDNYEVIGVRATELDGIKNCIVVSLGEKLVISDYTEYNSFFKGRSNVDISAEKR